ncbi:hypothetical protein TPHA_0B02260 [Tetrapisispora phaffii CBS 4417]|uniref:Peptidase M16 N-terminal domain-containing protein n=1 Tax=Tetrapisispora phaffii (strain ATCC 24235 / CBS 4417 / NBRC 1672 / NRRL Y-8282 / UCD 70-5) TaxID=1071381 RepID=G8BPG7_TETPH|nr:hypothetical protein TPHA_0B02260 [Tetrapisispora phaffii CBS 4417]CCE61898.1 hypothetical protein TPHA_0B02260 [Tetrapisispora phaffii CBS 4417]
MTTNLIQISTRFLPYSSACLPKLLALRSARLLPFFLDTKRKYTTFGINTSSTRQSKFNQFKFQQKNYYHQKMSNSYKTLNSDFLKPDLDDRSYRYIQLPNSLKALLISDPQTDKAAASIDVNVGAFEDPENLPGLAHFCEHLLFMGSEKFPDQNEYSSYLSKHGGHSNAYTAALNTNYFFEVNHEHLHGALDRFSGFFTGPLMNADSTEKEINAVDSENKKNLQNDDWRRYQMDKTISNYNHPYHKFSTGNIKTLMEEPTKLGLNTRNELLKFYNSSYSANIMKLCILGRQDLDTLSNWATEFFKDVKNLNKALPQYNENILEEEHLKKIIKIIPVKDLKKLEINFVVPDMDLHWESRPHHVLSHLIGHEGSGSILSYLKKLGWANDLSAGAHTVSKDNAFFGINVDLTDKGLENYQEIALLIFQYIEMLKHSLPQEWIFSELQDVSKSSFKFKQKSSPSGTVSELSKLLEKEYINPDLILSTTLLRKYEPEMIKQYVDSLTVDNSRITLISKTVETDSKEKWYGTEYQVVDYPKSFIDQLNQPGLNSEFKLPRRNEFVATNFEVKKPTDELVPLDEPHLILDNDISKVWYKKDDRFWQPRGYIYVSMKLPSCQSGIVNSLLNGLYVDQINDYMKDLQYDASCANLNLSFSSTNQGLDITISGFNDKLLVLLSRFIEGVKLYQPSEERFNIFKNKAIQNLKNSLFEVPYSQMGTLYNTIMNESTWPIKEKLDVLEALTFDQFVSFVPSIYNEFYFDALVHGNIRYEEAMEANDLLKSLASFKILNLHVRNSRLRSYILPEGESYRYEIDMEDKDNLNSCIQHVVQLGLYTEELSALSGLFAQMIREPCFDTLRTKEQLGYVVFSSNLNNHGTANMRILVQSEHSTSYLEWRIDEFYKKFGESLNNMSEEDFEKHKDALYKSLTQKYKNMREESSRYTVSIYLGDYNYTHRQKKAELVKKLTKQQMVDFYNDNFVSNKKSQLVIHLKSVATKSLKDLEENELDNSVYPSGKLIDNIDSFKSKMFAAPIRQPLKKFEVYNPKA